jgi:hypothetical protein
MVEKMRGVIQVVADNPPADDADGVPAYCAEFLASISPAEALREHDNEVAAKALEEEAFEFESANEGYSSRFVEVQDLVCMLRNVAEERRNKK